jgi:hypothetical protein
LVCRFQGDIIAVHHDKRLSSQEWKILHQDFVAFVLEFSHFRRYSLTLESKEIDFDISHHGDICSLTIYICLIAKADSNKKIPHIFAISVGQDD